jgi:hypothetical protein
VLALRSYRGCTSKSSVSPVGTVATNCSPLVGITVETKDAAKTFRKIVHPLQFVGRLKKLMSDLEPLVRIRRLHVKAGKVLEGRASRFWIRRAVHVHMRLGKRSGA